jgi:Tfp pilus assembly protein PilN
MPRDERRMTFIVVPHGGRDLSTRSFEISYRRLRTAGILLLVAVLLWLAMALSWSYLFAQSTRVQLMKHEIARLETENARVAELAIALRRLEAQYDQVRQMLGAGRPGSGGLELPSATGSAPTATADSAQSGDGPDDSP